MARNINPPKGASDFKKIVIHPELYKQLAHEALDEDVWVWERVHTVLCQALGRDDLMLQQEPTSAPASTR